MKILFSISSILILVIKVDMQKKATKIIYDAGPISSENIVSKDDRNFKSLMKRINFLCETNLNDYELIEYLKENNVLIQSIPNLNIRIK